MRPRKAVVLLSGGIDSSTCLAMALAEGRACHALTVRYGQRHEAELEAARKVVASLHADAHRIVRVDLDAFGGSALTDDIPVPKTPASPDIGIPVTYVPARNTVLLSLALAWSEVLEAQEIWLGVNAVDYSGYPDCRPAFIEAFQQLAELATRVGVEGTGAPTLRAPLIELSKSEIILAGSRLGVDHALTLSCYDPAPNGEACGLCEACRIRRQGFADAGIPDPTRYRP
ncbi:MAG: 7-cyano-7-deazaguanine synthase QueC [Planctomycetota bacterium]